jgi:hypothetical protein
MAFLIVTLIYGIIPGIGLLLAHVGIGEIHDNRAFITLDIEAVESVQGIYLCFSVSFALAYALVRRFSKVDLDHHVEAKHGFRVVAPAAFIVFAVLSISPGAIGADAATDYVSSYTMMRSMPLIVQQLFSIAGQIYFALLFAVIVFAVAAWPSRHLRVAVVIAAFLFYSSFSGGSRSLAFLCFFAYVIAVTVYSKRIAVSTMLVVGVAALVLFLVSGLFRGNKTVSSLALLQGGEFMHLFLNAIDLKSHHADAITFENEYIFYVTDLARLIPAQLWGSSKLDPAVWYMETFYPYYYDYGGGLAFGAIAECVMGLGALEASIRAALLGMLFAWLANNLMGRRNSLHRVFIYVWLVVMSYQSLRDTTFTLAAKALHQLVPFFLMLTILNFTRRKKQHGISKLHNYHEN